MLPHHVSLATPLCNNSGLSFPVGELMEIPHLVGLSVDIDECGTERANCGADQFCVNTEGSYECRGECPLLQRRGCGKGGRSCSTPVPRLFPANVCILWHQNPLDLGTALNLLSPLSSPDCAKACLGCMGAGPGRCKKCSHGYQQVGSKCLGESPANGVPCHHELRGAGI